MAFSDDMLEFDIIEEEDWNAFVAFTQTISSCAYGVSGNYIGHSGNKDIHFPSSQIRPWLDAKYKGTGATIGGGISVWYDLSAGTGVTPFGGSVSISGTQAEILSILGYNTISSNAIAAYNFSANTALVKNGFATKANGETISHGLGTIPNHVSVTPSGMVCNFGVNCKVDVSNITVYITAPGTRELFWEVSS